MTEPTQQDERTEALAAKERAEAALRRATERRPTVAKLTASLRKLRQDNHFAELIRESFEGRGAR